MTIRFRPLALSRGKRKLEQTRARIVAELDRIRAEVVGYATDSDATNGQVSELGEVLLGLGRLPRFCKSSITHPAYAADGKLRQVSIPKG